MNLQRLPGARADNTSGAYGAASAATTTPTPTSAPTPPATDTPPAAEAVNKLRGLFGR